MHLGGGDQCLDEPESAPLDGPGQAERLGFAPHPEAVSEKAAEIAGRMRRSTPRLDDRVSPGIASVAERVWWPAKLIDTALPSFIAPIKPRWSTELFDVPVMLVPRDDVLGISREHVYYRSSGHRGESVPARILWYVSEGNSGHQGKMVIGCSRLDEVLVDDPDTLFSRFERLDACVAAARHVAGVDSRAPRGLRSPWLQDPVCGRLDCRPNCGWWAACCSRFGDVSRRGR
ncbi:hypothetical protein [Streptomyces sp. WZ.A104]|uniref:hypothetical protein n=1 Tax=Streptomyces sp. WZ.A104 TaxID=2023771 RepID=UPI00211C8EB4|nr:hypothetical protein [Streptomyces sp. WZ.A104]